MKNIPIRQIKPTENEPKFSYTFRIREVKTILGGKDMVQDLHRHDFYFILALEKGKGNHVIDFIPYKVSNNCIFIMRPGQVHQLSKNTISFAIEVVAGFNTRARGIYCWIF